MKAKFISTILIIVLFRLSFTKETNAIFISNARTDEKIINTRFWVDPEIEIHKDKNDYKYKQEENITVSWDTKKYGTNNYVTLNIWVSKADSNNLEVIAENKIDISEYEIKHKKIKELFDISDENNFKFIIKIEGIDQNNLRDSDISKEYTYIKNDKEEKNENDKRDDESSQDKLTSVENMDTNPTIETPNTNISNENQDLEGANSNEDLIIEIIENKESEESTASAN